MLQRITSFYKLISRRNRFALCLLVLSVVLGYLYIDTIPPLEEELGQREMQREASQHRLAALQTKLEKLPQLEHEVATLQQKIEAGKTPLPTTVSIDQILGQTEEIAQKTGVNLHQFTPGEATLSTTPFRYFQIPIRIEMTGSFTHLAIFFDRMVHLSTLLHLQNISLGIAEKSAAVDSKTAAALKKNLRALKSQELLKASAEILAFRAAAPEEIAAALPLLGPGGSREQK